MPGQGYDQMFGAIFPHGQVGVAVNSCCRLQSGWFHSYQDPKVLELTRDIEKLLGAIRGVPCLSTCFLFLTGYDSRLGIQNLRMMNDDFGEFAA